MRSENFHPRKVVKVVANAASAPAPADLAWPPTLVGHLRRRHTRGRTVLAGMSGLPTPPFSGLTATSPPLSLCYRVLPTQGNIFMKE